MGNVLYFFPPIIIVVLSLLSFSTFVINSSSSKSVKKSFCVSLLIELDKKFVFCDLDERDNKNGSWPFSLKWYMCLRLESFKKSKSFINWIK